jgi:hypothetical protein
MPRGLSRQEKEALDRLAALPDGSLDDLEALLRTNKLFVVTVRTSIREALDDVIDGRRTRRFSYSELSSSEKSFCGVRIESVLVRNLELPPGVLLDVCLDGIDFDIKASSSGNWMIGPAQIDGPLLVIGFSELRRMFSVGLIRAYGGFMNPSRTRDSKRSLSAYAKRHIRWLARNEELPVSVLSGLPADAYAHVLAATARAERLRRLAYVPDYVPFPRSAIETVVGGDDPLRGTRADSRRAGTHPLGDVRVVSYQRNAAVRALGLLPLAKGEHMKVPAADVVG